MSQSSELLIAIDVDRTILNTDAAFDQFVTTCNDKGAIGRAVLLGAKKEVQASGGSFDVMGFLADAGMDAEQMQNLYDDFTTQADPAELLYADAMPLIDAIAERGLKSMFLTYGAVPWQLTKIKAAGLQSYPHLITGEKHKGQLITSWNQGGTYVVQTDNAGTFEADSVCVVDDKSTSFKGLPENCSGFMVQRYETVLPSQAGTVPANVLTIQGLEQIIPYLDK